MLSFELKSTDVKLDLLVPISEIKIERFSLLTRATLVFGTPTAGVVTNSVIVGMGVYTGGSSALQYGITTDPKAKALYVASTVFSASAVLSGGIAVASRTCHISGTAVVSEAFGFAFMQLGNKAHVTALQLEGKPIPPRLQRFVDPNIRPLGFNTDGLGFIMPRPISSTIIGCIPFETLGKVVGFSLSVYGYSKLIICAYRYSQQWISKYKQKQKRKKYHFRLFRQQAMFLIVSIHRCPTFRKPKTSSLF